MEPDRFDAAVAAPGKSMSDSLFERNREGFSAFVTLPSNAVAVESGQMFARGYQQFVALVGPSGWGKSHIMRCTAHMAAKELGQRVQVSNVASWAETLSNADSTAPLILDDAQIIFSSGRVRQRLRMVLERRQRGGKPTMLSFSVERPTRFLRLVLPINQHWNVTSLKAPTDSEKKTLVQSLARAQGIRIPDALASLLVKRVVRNGASLNGALQRLHLVQDDWTQPTDILKACGVLGALFSQEGAWDIRDHTFEVVAQLQDEFPKGLSRDEFCIYLMHHIQSMNEDQVGCFFGLPSTHVYRISNKITARVASGELKALQTLCCNELIRSFQA